MDETGIYFDMEKTLGLAGLYSGEGAGDDSLQKIFSISMEKHCPARFLRLGGPRQFRNDIIAIVDTLGSTATPGYKTLLSPDIPEIEFILTNPFSDAFLNRMDIEGKSNWEIWRVREQVLEFASGLLRASQQRVSRNLSEIRLAFHTLDLVWNLGIAEGHYVVMRAYYQSASGHDEHVAEIHLHPQSDTRLAESMLAYYQSIKNDERTFFVHNENELLSIGRWPSLYKGNVVHSSPDHPHWIEKTCCTPLGNQAEDAWLSYKETSTSPNDFFNPIKLGRRKQIDSPWKGQVSCIRSIPGVTANQFLWHIQKTGLKHPELIPNLELLAGSVLYQAFQALKEFRLVSTQVQEIKKQLRPYPWPDQLEIAIAEAGRFVIDNPKDLAACKSEARELCEALQPATDQPFRDAHLKNRIIAIHPGLLQEENDTFLTWVSQTEPAEMFSSLRASTYDIDFETGFWTVSRWDDPMHILWFNHLHFNLEENLKLLKTWWEPASSPSSARLVWLTLLCRSLREYCRRLWYDHTMPWTYQQRYELEPRDHFLDLAMFAADQIDGFTPIKDFLDRCKLAGDSIWKHKRTGELAEPVHAIYPPFISHLPGLEPLKSQDIDHSSLIAPSIPSLESKRNRYSRVHPVHTPALQPEHPLEPKIDFVLVTALAEERDALLDKLSGYCQLPPAQDDIRTYYQADLPVTFPGKTVGNYRLVVVSLLGMGRVQAVTATHDSIRRWHPRYIVLVGIAGGIEARGVQIGDILISDQIVDYELQKLTPQGPEIRWEVQRADPRLLNAAVNFRDESWQDLIKARRPGHGKPNRITGPIASGDKVIAFREVISRYQGAWPKLVGVEMEAAGVATAAFQSPDRPGFFMVRCVSDLADEKKSSKGVRKWRSYACDAAASYAVAFLKSGPIPLSDKTQ